MNTLEHCLASRLMCHLLSWRNPQGEEQNWYGQGRNVQPIPSVPLHVLKVVATECVLPMLAAIALVESVVYGILWVAVSPFYICSHRPADFFYSLIQSAVFTVEWALADMVANLFKKNLMTDEVLLKYSIGNNEPAVRNYARAWEAANRIHHLGVGGGGPIVIQPYYAVDDPPQVEALAPRLEPGARFLAYEVFPGLDAATLGDARIMLSNRDDLEYDVIQFVLARMLCIYVFGERRYQNPPEFLKWETRHVILRLRQEFAGQQAPADLWDALTRPERYLQGFPDGHATKRAFEGLRNGAANEFQGSDFLTRCWPRAFALRAA